MLLTEMFDGGYEDPKDDQTIPRLKDLRKMKLTLGHINKLRKIEDIRNYEYHQSLSNISRQYGNPAENSGGMM